MGGGRGICSWVQSTWSPEDGIRSSGTGVSDSLSHLNLCWEPSPALSCWALQPWDCLLSLRFSFPGSLPVLHLFVRGRGEDAYAVLELSVEPRQPHSHDVPTSASRVLGLQMYTASSGLISFIFFSVSNSINSAYVSLSSFSFQGLLLFLFLLLLLLLFCLWLFPRLCRLASVSF